MKLGVIYERIPNSNYRAVIPMSELERRGHTIVWPSEQEEVPRELATCDLVHCYRCIERVGDLHRLAAHGVAISFDNDDNQALSEIGYDTPQLRRNLKGHMHNKKLFRSVLEMAKLADLVTTTNDQLADTYRSVGASNVAVIENYLDSNMFGFGSSSKHEGTVVGWVAGYEHSLDVERIPIVAALTDLLAAHRDLRILTVGLRLPLHTTRYEYVKHVDYLDLLKITRRIDIGIAPLSDTPFNRCRSAVKLKEYSAGGAMWLASPVGPYRNMGEGEGGMLVEDDSWFTTLDALIRSRRTRKRLSKRALKWAKRQTIQHHVESWERAFVETIERKSQAVPAKARAQSG